MKNVFVFTGILSGSYAEEKIEENLRKLISDQQRPFKTGFGDDNPENIEIVDFTYTKSNPNKWLVVAKWKIKKNLKQKKTGIN